MATRALAAWMNGQHVGIWDASLQGVQTFRYDPAWVDSPAARALSLSLPFTAGGGEHRGEIVENYFNNLLPDNDEIRRRLSTRFRTRSTSAFDLLTAIGRDCVGAVQLLPEGKRPDGWDKIESEPLDDGQVERILASVTSAAPLGQDQEDDLRISIAGAQEKTALLHYGGTWRRPHGATPTTHILKLPLGLVGNFRGDLTESVENEWLCAQVLRHLGLKIANTSMYKFGKQKTLIVERFDRRWQGATSTQHDQAGFVPGKEDRILRLPQEDLCQATGTASNKKYEKDDGPSMIDSLNLLAGSERAHADRGHFALTQFAFWLLAATDGHAKNFSIAHHRGGTFTLTPLYDVISAWPIIGNGPNQLPEHDARLAMAVRSKNAHYKIREILARHWKALADRCEPDVWTTMLAMARNIKPTMAQVEAELPADFPVHVWQSVLRGVNVQSERFLREAEAIPST